MGRCMQDTEQEPGLSENLFDVIHSSVYQKRGRHEDGMRSMIPLGRILTYIALISVESEISVALYLESSVTEEGPTWYREHLPRQK